MTGAYPADDAGPLPAPSPGFRVRTLLGLTQARLAGLAGLKQSWLSAVETGRQEPGTAELARIADAAGTPASFFSVRPAAVPLDSLRFRKLARASPVTTRRVSTFYRESYRVADSLLAGEDYPRTSLPRATEPELGDGAIEEYAAAARRALGLAPDQPVPYVTRALERAGVAVAQFTLTDFDSGELGTSGHHFGVSYRGSAIGGLALIGYFPGEHGDRDRFTLAHELGHIILHSFRPEAARAEDEANRFAGALLLPRDQMLRDLSDDMPLEAFARFKATWGASIQAIIMRARQLGVITEAHKRSLFMQMSQYGWRASEPVKVGREEPRLLGTLLVRRFGDRPYLEGADKLAIPSAILRSIAPLPQARPPAGRARYDLHPGVTQLKGEPSRSRLTPVPATDPRPRLPCGGLAGAVPRQHRGPASSTPGGGYLPAGGLRCKHGWRLPGHRTTCTAVPSARMETVVAWTASFVRESRADRPGA
jgi:transcriptional regulator with XRE-family HTH domain